MDSTPKQVYTVSTRYEPLLTYSSVVTTFSSRPADQTHLSGLMVDSQDGRLVTEDSLQEDYGINTLVATLVEEHIWVIGIFTCILTVLVLLSCSLRSNYFHENYFIVRAKEWVHLPLLQPSGPPDSLITAEAPGMSANAESERPNESAECLPAQHDTCSWVSETALNSSLVDGGQEKSLINQDMSTLTAAPRQEDIIEPVATDSELSSTLRHHHSFKKDQFVFNADLFLTKSESLDESQSRSQLRDKCLKANRSVDEILSSRSQSQDQSKSEQSQPDSAASSIPCTPKCRKLQERRGSNHSLTIAVGKPAETNILPTVVTPRECSATQFLLTAGNCMNRQQLRACLRDVKGLHAEFWSIPTNVPELVELVSGCAIKNRYRYILPNPQSRVKLPVLEPSDPTSGYMNGNYVRAHNGDARAYIATQGPLSNTINDFWLMVWTERAPAIVMITKLVESGKAKCEPYLPADGEISHRYGDLIVNVDSIEESSGWTVRQLTLKNNEEVHQALHYWYSDWPDHKTPENPKSLVDLAVTIESLRRGQTSLLSNETTTVDVGPVVVHCSAGVGRTGCFIAICQGLSQLIAEGKVDILGIVCALRCDRGGMVQTAEQYEFIHRGLCLFERSTLADYTED